MLLLKKKEKIFLTILVFFTIFLGIGIHFFKPEVCEYITITVSGTPFGTYPLNHEQIIPINDTNILEIKNGEASMISAVCPDHLCMEQYPIDKDGGTIVCLPNKVVIEGGKTESSEIDAVS